MPVKPVFRKDVGGTLTFDVPEIGAITGTPTCSVFQPGDASDSPTATPAVTTASAGSSTTAGQLTAPITAAVCDALHPTYRAQWSYTCAGVARVTNQIFGVVKSAVVCPLNAPVLLRLYPLVRNASSTTIAQFIADTWGSLHNLLRQRELDPDRIVDASGLLEALAAYTAAAISRNLAAGNPATNEWQARAELWEEEGRRSLEGALSALWWYDASQDLQPGGAGAEENVDLGDVVITR